MRRHFVALALALVTTSMVVAAQGRKLTMQADGITTCHTYDPAKLAIVERKRPDRQASSGEVVVWRILTDYGLIVGTLATKPEADAAFAAAKKFTRMCLIGPSPNTFTYFER
jgi:hypothetical protein